MTAKQLSDLMNAHECHIAELRRQADEADNRQARIRKLEEAAILAAWLCGMEFVATHLGKEQ